jgi:hypothetical protein
MIIHGSWRFHGVFCLQQHSRFRFHDILRSDWISSHQCVVRLVCRWVPSCHHSFRCWQGFNIVFRVVAQRI